ncbi:hypothetical protein ACTMU2_21305 [Cupriavidus basilensis]
MPLDSQPAFIVPTWPVIQNRIQIRPNLFGSGATMRRRAFADDDWTMTCVSPSKRGLIAENFISVVDRFASLPEIWGPGTSTKMD